MKPKTPGHALANERARLIGRLLGLSGNGLVSARDIQVFADRNQIDLIGATLAHVFQGKLWEKTEYKQENRNRANPRFRSAPVYRLAAPSGGTKELILKMLTASNGRRWTSNEVSEAMGRGERSNVHNILRKLWQDGKLESEKDGRQRLYWVPKAKEDN